MKERFAIRLKALRKEFGLTQEQLAESFGVTIQAVSKWETGSSYPDIELLPKIADFFGVTVDELLTADAAELESREACDCPARTLAEETPAALDACSEEARADADRFCDEEDSGKAQSGERTWRNPYENISFTEFPNDGVLRVVWCRGNTVIGSGEPNGDNKVEINIEGSVKRLEVYGDTVVNGGISGDVCSYGDLECAGGIEGDVKSYSTVNCEGVEGDVNAYGSVNCKGIDGDVNAGGNVNAVDIHGDVRAGGNVSAADVDGDVQAGGLVSCADINGDVRAGNDVNCATVRGDATANGCIRRSDMR